MFRAFFFRRPAILESAATCSLPREGRLGRGHSPNFSNLSQHPNRPNTSLAACCPLSNSLPRGERTGWLLELRVLQRNGLCRLLFAFQTAFKMSNLGSLHLVIFKNPIKISRLLTCRLLSSLPPHSAIIRPTPPVPAV